MKREKRLKKSCPHAGSNYRPSVYKTDALPLSYRGNRILRQFELYLFECCHQGTRPRPQYCLPPAAPSHSSLRLHSRRLSSPGAAVTSLASEAREPWRPPDGSNWTSSAWSSSRGSRSRRIWRSTSSTTASTRSAQPSPASTAPPPRCRTYPSAPTVRILSPPPSPRRALRFLALPAWIGG